MGKEAVEKGDLLTPYVRINAILHKCCVDRRTNPCVQGDTQSR